MNDQDQASFDHRIADWLEGDPNEAPDQTVQVVLAALPSVKQRHASRLPWRFRTMPTPFKLALGATAVVAVVLGSVYVLGPPSPSGGVGGPDATPSPTAKPSPAASAASTASAAIDTATWTAFTSERYGFSTTIPSNFISKPSTKFWVVPESDATTLDEWDLFFGGPGNNTWAAASVMVPAGTSTTVWFNSYRQNQVDTSRPAACSPRPYDTTPVTIDSMEGYLRVGCGDIEVIVFTDDRAFSFSGWTDPRDMVGIPADFRALFEAWLTTIRLDPASALEPPADSPSPPASPSAD